MEKSIPLSNLFIDQAKIALEKAKAELHLAIYLGECGCNAGLRKIWSDRADWLACLIYLAEAQISREELDNDILYPKGAPIVEVLNAPPTEKEVLSETICMDEGPNQFKTIKYRPTCVHGCTDCIWDPAYIYATYPNWYKRLYGEAKPVEVACENCADGERYDDEDK